MQSLALKIPPVVVVIVCMGVMWVCGRFLPLADFFFPGQKAIMVSMGVFAVVICLAAMLGFNRHQTTVNPTDPSQASSLITTGIFNYSRNPIYLAFALFLVAWGLRMGNVVSLLWLPVFIAYLHYFQIKPEERILSDKFGKPFDAYCQRVRRWI